MEMDEDGRDKISNMLASKSQILIPLNVMEKAHDGELETNLNGFKSTR